MVFGYVYESGLRPVNQDAVLVRSTRLSSGELTMAVVCDGMGGEECGERASYECIRFLDAWYDRELLPIFTKHELDHAGRKRMVRTKGTAAFYDINKYLFSLMRKKEGRLGTTASLCILYRNEYYILHIGDSRIYFAKRMAGQTFFFERTKDHALYHRLTKCLGLNRDYKPDYIAGRIWFLHIFQAAVLLCTDGFYKKYEKRVWKECLDIRQMTDENAICRRLKELAMDNLKRQEKDNITAIWLKMRL